MVTITAINNWINRTSNTKIAFLLFIIALTLRLFYIVLFSDSGFLNEGDNMQYLVFAEEIINQGVFVTDIDVKNDIVAGSLRILGPGYPLIIAAFISLFGSNFFPIFLFNAILTSLTVVVLYFLTTALTKNRTAALFVSFWGIINFSYFKYTPFLLKESLVYFLFPLTLLLLIKEVKNKSISKYIILAILSFSYLIHSDERYFVYFPFFAVLFFFGNRISSQIIYKRLLIWFVGVLILMAPWLYRNYLVYDQLVILTERTTKITSLITGRDLTNDYYSISQNTNIDYAAVVDSVKNNQTPTSVDKKKVKLIEWAIDKDLNPHLFEPTEKYLRAAINFWRPTYFKPSLINDGFRPQHWSLSHNLISLGSYGIFLPFYFIGLIALIFQNRKKQLLLFVSLIPIIHMMIHVGLVHVLERYRSPIDFIVILIAVHFISVFINKYKGKQNRERKIT